MMTYIKKGTFHFKKINNFIINLLCIYHTPICETKNVHIFD